MTSPDAGATAPVGFRPLARADLAMLRDWLNTPHVYEWWGAGSGEGALGGPRAEAATLEQVEAKYVPAIDADGATHRFVIEVADLPVGLIQWYRLEDDADYARAIGVASGAGIDLLIGVPEMRGRGIGPRAIHAFARDIVFAPTDLPCCVAGPATENTRSIRAFEKAGFLVSHDADIPGETYPERIMILRREQVAS